MPQLPGGVEHLGGRSGIHGADQVSHGHGRDQRVAGLAPRVAVWAEDVDRVHPAAIVQDPDDPRTEVGVHAAGRRQVPAPLPHHAGSETRVVEALDETRDHLAAGAPRCRATHS